MVTDTVSKSSTLKEGLKNEILSSMFDTEEQIQSDLKTQQVVSKRLAVELKGLQSTLADVETNKLLNVYEDETVYQGIVTNLKIKITQTKDEIEQTRLRIKELGKEQKWLDWVGKYAEHIDAVCEFTDEERKDYLEGIVDRINVFLDKETLDH